MRAYVSHPIRGQKGASATDEDMAHNNKRAMSFANLLRERFPSLELYVPAEHDEFVSRAHKMGFLTEEQLLFVDAAILRTCAFVILYMPDNYISAGMLYEAVCATCSNIPVVVCKNDVNHIGSILDSMKR